MVLLDTTFAVYSLLSLLATIGGTYAADGVVVVEVSAIFLCLWQGAVWCGWIESSSSSSDFLFALFLQGLTVATAQLVVLFCERPRRTFHWYILPMVMVATPVGQLMGRSRVVIIATGLVQAIAGVLIVLMAAFYTMRLYRNDDVDDDKLAIEAGQEQENDLEKGKKEPDLWETDVDSSSEELSDAETSFHDLYRVEQKIGEGAFGVVKKGTLKRTGKSFAIKTVRKSQLLEEEEEKLHYEVACMRKLSHHPNIVRLVDVFWEEPQPDIYLVLEHMKGGDLYTRLVEVSYFAERPASQICRSILGAVAYMHSKKIAHRDLKPENLLFTHSSANGDDDDATGLKVADFGLAKRADSPNALTTLCGTPAYVAWEIVNGFPYSVQVDVWSVGVIAFTLLAGYHPFRGDNATALEAAIRKGSFQFEQQEHRKDTTSSTAKDLISSMLITNPSERLTAKEALKHPWLQNKASEGEEKPEGEATTATSKDKHEPDNGNVACQMDGSHIPPLRLLGTLSAVFVSAFTGGLCGICGPPLRLYSLFCAAWPPANPEETTSQRQLQESVITFTAFLRTVYYIGAWFLRINEDSFDTAAAAAQQDWPVYVCAMASAAGGALFACKFPSHEMMKAAAPIRSALAIAVLLLGGVGLVLTPIVN